MSEYTTELAKGVFGLAVTGVVGLSMYADVSVDLSDESKDMAQYGKLDANLSCAEQAAASKKIADYFAKHAKDGAKNPDFTITKEECMAIMAARQAAPAAKP